MRDSPASPSIDWRIALIGGPDGCISLTGKERFAAHEPTGEAVPAHDLHAQLDQAAGEIGGQVIAWRHHLHSHPELSNRETATAHTVADHLRSLELDEVRTGIAGHGVVGVLHGGGDGDRVVALRADIDALPIKEESGVDFASTVVDEDYPGGASPVAHACGHACHTAMLIGAASVLAPARDELPGTILFVFQPADEGPPIDEDGGAVSYFVDKYGGAYLQLGAQDVELRPDGTMAPEPGGRGIAMNHNPHFYADDSVLETGVRIHANVALDHLTGAITASG